MRHGRQEKRRNEQRGGNRFQMIPKSVGREYFLGLAQLNTNKQYLIHQWLARGCKSWHVPKSSFSRFSTTTQFDDGGLSIVLAHVPGQGRMAHLEGPIMWVQADEAQMLCGFFSGPK